MSQMQPVAVRLLGRIKSQTWPFVRGIRDEPHVGALTWEVPNADIVQVEDKREASFIASQTLHYLRSCLDHLVYNASWIDQGAPRRMTQFPICDDRNKWSNRNVQKQLGGMSTGHSSWIEQVQPFNGVTWTRDLQELSNADKHRFGVEVSPTCQLRVNIVDAIPDPSANNVTLAQIENIGLHFRLPALTPYGEFSDVFNGMLVGAADLLNLFLDQAGIETIEVGAAWTVAPDSCI